MKSKILEVPHDKYLSLEELIWTLRAKSFPPSVMSREPITELAEVFAHLKRVGDVKKGGNGSSSSSRKGESSNGHRYRDTQGSAYGFDLKNSSEERFLDQSLYCISDNTWKMFRSAENSLASFGQITRAVHKFSRNSSELISVQITFTSNSTECTGFSLDHESNQINQALNHWLNYRMLFLDLTSDELLIGHNFDYTQLLRTLTIVLRTLTNNLYAVYRCALEITSRTKAYCSSSSSLQHCSQKHYIHSSEL
ncbi:calcineurin B-like protein 1 [Dorcoceras hygrometricum]|uniref:Calcineurin B-like protein 1 n=1 Tax=Dorcoceras hygrometricum TaxID=472368 RepID=A0A2Z7AD01_9LAMI|nr:calcineurin B-like protein 1 [Dorcoceras hygrometricum]